MSRVPARTTEVVVPTATEGVVAMAVVVMVVVVMVVVVVVVVEAAARVVAGSGDISQPGDLNQYWQWLPLLTHPSQIGAA